MTRLPKILIAVQDPDTRQQIDFACAYYHRPYDVFLAPTASSALKQFGIVQPDLVLLEVGSPGHEGWEALRRIRQQSAVPVIVLAQAGAFGPESASRTCGGDLCLGLPLSVADLCAHVTRILARSQG